jgi:aspartokinase/homoserine dehydrogenase 1
MYVLKFGGTSLGNEKSISQVIEIVKDYSSKHNQLIVVASAQSGITNKLVEISTKCISNSDDAIKLANDIEYQHIQIARHFLNVDKYAASIAEIISICNELKEIIKGCHLIREISPRTTDLILSFGERLSAFTFSEILKMNSENVRFVDARKIIVTNDQFGAAKVDFEDSDQLIKSEFKNLHGIAIVTGFIASSHKGETTTLGRSGSDYTAAILGAALDAEAVEIWTDVDGMMTVDPRVVKEARCIPNLSYTEAMELSHFGAKVVFPATMNPLMNKNIPILVKNTFNASHPGTIISKYSGDSDQVIKGISSLNEVSLLSIYGSGMLGVSGISGRIFSALAKEKINVLLISQASSEHSICVAIQSSDSKIAIETLMNEFKNELNEKSISSISCENELAIVAVVGSKMKELPGIASRILSPLGKNGINIIAIAQGSSEINISIVIAKKTLYKALNVLHQSIFENEVLKLNLFIVGTGSIGKNLISIIKQNEVYNQSKKIELKIVGLANSRRMLIDPDNVIESFFDHDNQNHNLDLNLFVDQIIEGNFENAVFIDLTSSYDPVELYEKLISNTISIVTASKKANTQNTEKYHSLHELIQRKNGFFHYETNVGAGLPIINTIQNFKLNGDEVKRISAVLSGTLNYLLSEYNGSIPFSELVSLAKENNYTEPDPRDDLSGMDVARKSLILARECGWDFELEDIKVESLMSNKAEKAKDMDSFFVEMKNNDLAFYQKYKDANSRNEKLRYIAKIDSKSITISLESVNESSPFYGLSGTENCISIMSDFYQKYPMVIKGPGAGVEVTASGVLSDIIKIAKNLKLKF